MTPEALPLLALVYVLVVAALALVAWDERPVEVADDAGNERLVPNHPWGEGSDA